MINVRYKYFPYLFLTTIVFATYAFFTKIPSRIELLEKMAISYIEAIDLNLEGRKLAKERIALFVDKIRTNKVSIQQAYFCTEMLFRSPLEYAIHTMEFEDFHILNSGLSDITKRKALEIVQHYRIALLLGLIPRKNFRIVFGSLYLSNNNLKFAPENIKKFYTTQKIKFILGQMQDALKKIGKLNSLESRDIPKYVSKYLEDGINLWCLYHANDIDQAKYCPDNINQINSYYWWGNHLISNSKILIPSGFIK